MGVGPARFLLVFVFVLAGCGSGPSMTPREKHALDVARRCAVEEHNGRGVHGSRLLLAQAKIKHSDDSGDVVYIPEEQPRGRPMGLSLHIEPDTSKCTRLPI